MKTKTRPQVDPVVQEVREARAKLWNEGGGTIEGFLRVVRERVAGRKRGVKTSLKSNTPRRRRK